MVDCPQVVKRLGGHLGDAVAGDQSEGPLRQRDLAGNSRHHPPVQ